MKRLFLTAALAALTLLAFAPARADSNDYPYQGRTNFTIDGSIRHIDTDHNRMDVAGNDGTRYQVDTSDSDIMLPSGNSAGRLDDLAEGQSVHVIGTLLDGDLIEADRVRIVQLDTNPVPFTDAHMDYEHISAATDPAPTAARAASPSTFEIDGLVREVDPTNDKMTIVDSNDNRYTVDTLGSDIILPASSAAGHCADLARGMHVHLVGSQLSSGVIVADRVSVQNDADLALAHQAALQPAASSVPLAPVTLVVSAPPTQVLTTQIEAAPDPAPVPPASVNVPTNYSAQDFPQVDLDDATGILIDCRDLPDISRSPAPTIVGPDDELLYPDRSHVPSPDEVQEESIVRYYRTMDDSMSGVAGAHPLILHAVCVVGPAQDGVELSAQDMALFIALDKRLHYDQNWKVGFLVPPDK